MRVRIVTEATSFGEELISSLQGDDIDLELAEEEVDVLELRYRRDTDLSRVSELISGISPMLPRLVPTDELEVDAELRVGDEKSFEDWDLKFIMEDNKEAQSLQQKLLPLGFCDLGIDNSAQTENRLEYGGASPFARAVVRWYLDRLGYQLKEVKVWGDDDNDMYVRLTSGPAIRDSEDIKDVCEIDIYSDDLAAMEQMRARLADLGFTNVHMKPIDPSETEFFQFDKGLLDQDYELFAAVKEQIDGMLAEQGVDPAGYPVMIEDSARLVRILLPLGAMRSGALRPYAGSQPERWDFQIRTDALADIEPFVEGLREQSYDVTVQPLPATCLGFRLATRPGPDQEELVEDLEARLHSLLGDLGFDPTALSTSTSEEMRSGLIEIDLPVASTRDGSIEARIRRGAADWECTLKTRSNSDFPSLATRLERMEFKSYDREETTVGRPEIKYGGAPRAIVEFVARVVKEETGFECTLQKAWGDSDDDIWIHLPSPTTQSAEVDGGLEDIDLDAWFAAQAGTAATELVAVGPESVRIGHITLPRRTDAGREFVPAWQSFMHYCLDQRTAESLLHVAEGVMLREPVLLEGETSVSKTSIIQFLAMLLDQPLVRLNLNGQTDTGELVGRFLPQNVASDLPVDPDELHDAMELLEAESKIILTRAKEEGRPLTQVEVQQVMANERMHTHPWKWQDGLVVMAMRNGWWIVLDELNLAEPQILERLNSVLEREPTLVLTEHDNTVFGRGGVPVHPNFRVFATMNPAEYAGRSALSPAYRDRWRGYRFVDPPAESDYHAMLSFLVTGKQPDVVLRGRPFTGVTQPPAFGALGEIPDIEGFLVALARFHTALESAVRNPEENRASELGVRRQERYVFTRRGLLAVMDYLAGTLGTTDSVESMRVALARYYLGRVAAKADRITVARLLDAAGIGLETWDLSHDDA